MRIPVYHSYPTWQLSGVNTWTANMISAMRDSAFDSRVLFTGITESPQKELEASGIPYEFLDVHQQRKGVRNGKLLKRT
jgi:hypothetical protein